MYRIRAFLLVGAYLLCMSGCETAVDEGTNELTGTDDWGTDSDSGAAEVCDVGDPSAVCVNGPLSTIQLYDNNNYFFSSSLDVSSIVVRGGNPLVDLTFDWSGLTKDFMGHALNPLVDIEMAVITLWSTGQAEMKEMLDADALDMNKFISAVMAYPGDQFTSENLVDFTVYGTPIVAPGDVSLRDSYFNSDDPNYDPNGFTHMFFVQRNADSPGRDISMIQFFTLDSDATNTTIPVTDNSSTLTYEVDLKTLGRIPVSPGNPGINIIWDTLTVNAMGNAFVPTLINRVVVAHYSMSVCSLENQFLDVETVHDQWYEGIMENVGLEFDLSQLTDANGAPFPGITNDGLWIIALFCNEQKCSNPAPQFLSILQAC